MYHKIKRESSNKTLLLKTKILANFGSPGVEVKRKYRAKRKDMESKLE
jgi:hypothetical protein